MDKDADVGVSGEPRDHNPRLFNGVLDDPEMDELSFYEKKALLIDRELDSHGMGKYQVCFYFTFEEVSLVIPSEPDSFSGIYSSYVASATC